MSPSQPRSRRQSESSLPEVRLQKILADAGIASRRSSEDLIRAGRVRVNGQVVTKLGARAHPLRDKIEVDGRRVGRARRAVHYLVHKPRGVVTTTRDPEARKTVLDLVSTSERLFPVGRLDRQSEGLVLLTNDGGLAQVLLHPSFEVVRTYRVSVDGNPSAAALEDLAQGIVIEGRRTAPCGVRVLERSSGRAVLELELIEGRRRQIRLALESLGHPVRRLKRTRFGPLRLGALAAGRSRRLDAKERAALERLVSGGKNITSAHSRRKKTK
jgi:pseudouridine synthase